MLYDVTLAGVSATAPSDGFIDPKTVYVYGNSASPSSPTTYAQSLAKARANNRHKAVTGTVQHYGGMEITNVTTGGTPSATAAPTNIVYRVDARAEVSTHDETDPGEILTGTDAIKRIFARALIRVKTTAMEVLDPTTGTAPGNEEAFARAGARINVETVGALYADLAAAEAGITVTAV